MKLKDLLAEIENRNILTPSQLGKFVRSIGVNVSRSYSDPYKNGKIYKIKAAGGTFTSDKAEQVKKFLKGFDNVEDSSIYVNDRGYFNFEVWIQQPQVAPVDILNKNQLLKQIGLYFDISSKAQVSTKKLAKGNRRTDVIFDSTTDEIDIQKFISTLEKEYPSVYELRIHKYRNDSPFEYQIYLTYGIKHDKKYHDTIYTGTEMFVWVTLPYK